MPDKAKVVRGLDINPEFLTHICRMIYEEQYFVKKDYEMALNFFDQVLKQPLNINDRNTIAKYLTGFKNKHDTRYMLWNELNGDEDGSG